MKISHKRRKYIHINQHKIKSNHKNKTDEPVITVKDGKNNTYGHHVLIHGPSRVRYSETDKPILSCGARVVIETYAPVDVLLREESNNDIDKQEVPIAAHAV